MVRRHAQTIARSILIVASCVAPTVAEPLSQDGLILWLDAGDVNNDGKPEAHDPNGKPLASWSDKSGKGNHVHQNKIARQPTRESGQLGGQPVVRFHGDDLLTREKFEGFVYRDQPIHVVLVMKTLSGGAHPRPRLVEFQPVGGDLSSEITRPVRQIGLWTGSEGDGRMRIGTYYGDEGSALSSAWDAKPHVVEIVYAGAQNWVHYLDGARDGAGLFGDRDFHGFKKDVHLAIGQHFGLTDSNSYFEGDLAEVLIYNRVLTPDDQNSVKSYLAEKYSLDLSIEPVPNFERDVRPILAQRCHDCHGADKQESDLDLRTVTAMFRGGKSGPVITRGHPEFSDLFDLVVNGKMPPDGEGPLGDSEIRIIRHWIEAGAPADEPVHLAPSDHLITEEDRSFWAYQRLVQQVPPKVTGAERVRTSIDQFVLAKLEQQGLTYAPDTDRATLLRRLNFHLIGLPPSQAEIDRFLADESREAFEKVVDRLLDSEHFGERWGRHWLDWSGYVDVYGNDMHFNIIKPLDGKWRYRDYVVRSFNKDKPVDRFLVEQLAGDELVDWRGAERYTPELLELLTATAFLLCGTDDTDQDFKNTPDTRHHVLQATGEIVANNLFALKLECARCHNHKYEAIPQHDYYGWLAIFSPVFNPQRWVTAVEHGIPDVSKKDQAEIDAHNAQIDRDIAELKTKQDALRRPYRQKLYDKKLAALPELIRANVRVAVETAADKRSETQKDLAENLGGQIDVTPEEITAALTSNDKNAWAKLDGQIGSLDSQRRSYGIIQVSVENSPPSSTYLLRRGDVTTPGTSVEPGMLSILSDSSLADSPGGRISSPSAEPRKVDGLQFRTRGQTSGRRLALAIAITDPDSIAGSLVARVLVNRIWQELHGKGIVATSDNFGVSGSLPTHPELLDWLALEFIRGDWRVKPLIKRMVMSGAYRQASVRSDAEVCEKVDPSNNLLWRARLRRLPSEVIRDAILVTSGKLDRTLGGPPIPLEVKPDGRIVIMKDGLPTPTTQWRRSLYVLARRNYHLSLLTTFDQPFVTANCTFRQSAAVVTQSLTMLNDEFVLEQARFFANRVAQESNNSAPEVRVATAYRIAFGRNPMEKETTWSVDLLRRHNARFSQTNMPPDEADKRALVQFCHMLLNANEFLYIQ
jgi:hypothetical protein